LGYIRTKILEGQDCKGSPIQKVCPYPVSNAFWEEVDFGDNPFGVYRAVVGDVMHFDELGKTMYMRGSLVSFNPSVTVNKQEWIPLLRKYSANPPCNEVLVTVFQD
jgi:hypothetical protein